MRELRSIRRLYKSVQQSEYPPRFSPFLKLFLLSRKTLFSSIVFESSISTMPLPPELQPTRTTLSITACHWMRQFPSSRSKNHTNTPRNPSASTSANRKLPIMAPQLAPAKKTMAKATREQVRKRTEYRDFIQRDVEENMNLVCSWIEKLDCEVPGVRSGMLPGNCGWSNRKAPRRRETKNQGILPISTVWASNFSNHLYT